MKYLLFILCFFVSGFSIGQTNYLKVSELNTLIEDGDLKIAEGDYFGAIHFYDLAFNIDSTAEGLIYRLAISNKGFHNYSVAMLLLLKIDKDPILKNTHPDYLFHIADILKREGKYAESEKAYKKFVRSYKIKNDQYYLFAKNEVKVFPKVYELLKDTVDVEITNLGNQLNTGSAEFNSYFTSDTSILFSTLRASKSNKNGSVDREKYVISVYKGIEKDSIWRVDSSFKSYSPKSITNGSFDEEKYFYYSKLEEVDGFQIYKSENKVGQLTYKNPIKLSINAIGSASKNPHFFRIGLKEYLLFTSNRKGGKGGWDLWYSEFKRGKWNNPKNLGFKVNSPGDEVAPFFDNQKNIIYFASNWHYNIGGFDIFKATGNWKRPSAIENLGIPLNSSENDLYYSPYDSLKGMFTSSRIGAITDRVAVCCNDLFSYQFPNPKVLPVDISDDVSTMLRLQRLIEEYHVTLYFHNDRPNPDNWDTITPYSYLETYNSYIKRIPTYRSEYSNLLVGEDSLAAVDEIQDFFDDYVHRGVKDLDVFTGELIKELNNGNKIELFVKGYASPLAKSDYNVNLTLRRINSLQNYLRRYPGGVFARYLDNKAANGGLLKIVKVPFGEHRSDTTVSDDFYDTRNSVYSKSAALERKIEIINLQLINDSTRKETPFSFNLDSTQTTYNLGKIDSPKFSWRFYMENSSDALIEIDSISTGCQCLAPKRSVWKIKPGEIEPLDLDFDMNGYNGAIGRKVEVFFKSGENRSLILLFEL
jgi:tetratricopeptide (TPR) repeat protein